MSLPSGPDSTQYSVYDGGFGVGGQGLSYGVSGLQGLSQDYVTNHYQNQQQGSPGWGNASNAFFNVVLGGFQTIADFLGQLVHAITGGIGSTFTALQDFFNARASEVLDLFGHVQSIADNIFNAAFNVVTSGNPIGAIFDAIGAMLGFTHTAQSSADTANVGLTILTNRVNGLAGGASFYDTFSRNNSDLSTDPNYDVRVNGGSGNPYLTDVSDGRLRWNAVGFSDTNFVARLKNVPMTTNKNRVSVVIDAFTYGFAGNQAHTWLMGRQDAAVQNYVIGIVEGGAAEIGCVVAGSYTRFGGTESVSTSTGDLWDLEIGVGADEWRFRLLQNNSLRVDRTDLGHISKKDTTPGTTFKYTAVGGDCAIGAGPFGSTYQIGMPDFQVFAVGDVT